MKELLKRVTVLVDVCLNFWFSCVMNVFCLLCKCAVNSCRALWSNLSTSSLERKRPCEPSVSPASSFLNESGPTGDTLSCETLASPLLNLVYPGALSPAQARHLY